MRKMPRCGSPVSGSPAFCSANPTAAINAWNGASTSASYTALRGLNQAGSLLSRSSAKNANAPGPNPVNAFVELMFAIALTPAAGVEQELAVTIGAADRALDDPDHGPARLCRDPAGNAITDF